LLSYKCYYNVITFTNVGNNFNWRWVFLLE